MRTVIDLPEEYIHQLDILKKEKNVSRNEIIKRMVYEYIKKRTPKQEAFGLLSKKPVDGVAHQKKLRTEWDNESPI